MNCSHNLFFFRRDHVCLWLRILMKYLEQLGGLGIALDFVKISAHNKNFI